MEEDRIEGQEQEEEERVYSVVVYGATGYVGRLIVEQLAGSVEMTGRRWAVAGRNAERLEAMRIAIPAATAPDVVVADDGDYLALDVMARRAKVLVNAAGPFGKHGANILESCVNNRTHYCDVSSEASWVRRMMLRHGPQAATENICIVPMVGFSTGVGDLACLLLRKEAASRGVGPVSHVAAGLRGPLPDPSGGSLATAVRTATHEPRDVVKAGFSGGYLCPQRKAGRSPPPQTVLGVWWDAKFRAWRSPWPGATVASHVVHRSCQLEGVPVHRYSEVHLHDGFISAVAAALLLYLLALVLLLPPLRWAAQRWVFRNPGTGLSRTALASRRYNVSYSAPPLQLEVSVTGDACYLGTAVMAAQVALMLSDPSFAPPEQAGFLTPAAAGGMDLVARLERTGVFSFRVV